MNLTVMKKLMMLREAFKLNPRTKVRKSESQHLRLRMPRRAWARLQMCLALPVRQHLAVMQGAGWGGCGAGQQLEQLLGVCLVQQMMQTRIWTMRQALTSGPSPHSSSKGANRGQDSAHVPLRRQAWLALVRQVMLVQAGRLDQQRVALGGAVRWWQWIARRVPTTSSSSSRRCSALPPLHHGASARS